jgi:signal transduction histidine kinase
MNSGIMEISNSVTVVKQKLEMQLFLYAMYLAVAFRVVQTAHHVLIESPLIVILPGIINLLLLWLFLRLYPNWFKLSLVTFFLVPVISTFFFWNETGGWDGSRPYTLLVLIVGIILISHGLMQVALLLVYGVMLATLSVIELPTWIGSLNPNYNTPSLEFDFLVNALMLILIVVHLKTRFTNYRSSVSRTNEELIRVTKTLDSQTEQLRKQQLELDSLRNNLEGMVADRIREVRTKSAVLREYAFVNAHHVRAPLARMLGLIYLIELENGYAGQPERLDKIKSEARRMDAIIQQINDITG